MRLLTDLSPLFNCVLFLITYLFIVFMSLIIGLNIGALVDDTLPGQIFRNVIVAVDETDISLVRIIFMLLCDTYAMIILSIPALKIMRLGWEMFMTSMLLAIVFYAPAVIFLLLFMHIDNITPYLIYYAR